eukprot:2474538-Pyramimonas_sp.AAC.2
MVHRPGRQDAQGEDAELELDRLRESVLNQAVPSTFQGTAWANVFRGRKLVEEDVDDSYSSASDIDEPKPPLEHPDGYSEGHLGSSSSQR